MLVLHATWEKTSAWFWVKHNGTKRVISLPFSLGSLRFWTSSIIIISSNAARIHILTFLYPSRGIPLLTQSLRAVSFFYFYCEHGVAKVTRRGRYGAMCRWNHFLTKLKWGSFFRKTGRPHFSKGTSNQGKMEHKQRHQILAYFVKTLPLGSGVSHLFLNVHLQSRRSFNLMAFKANGRV